ARCRLVRARDRAARQQSSDPATLALHRAGNAAVSGISFGRRAKSAIGPRSRMPELDSLSLQERCAPNNACWGCGPANPDGLRIRSFPKGDEVVAEWQPEKKYEAFPGVLNGGIIGTLLDCHCNWTAAYHLMKRAGADHPPCTVTAEYAIKLFRPTPTSNSVFLSARVVNLTDD